MHLTIREEERTSDLVSGGDGPRRLSRGMQRIYPEAIAVICDGIFERAR